MCQTPGVQSGERPPRGYVLEVVQVNVIVSGRTVRVKLHATLAGGGKGVACGRCGEVMARVSELRARLAFERRVVFAEIWRPDGDGIIRRSSRTDRGLPTPRRPRRWAAPGEFKERIPKPGETRERPGGWYLQEYPAVAACKCSALNILSAKDLRIGTFPKVGALG